MKRTRLKRKHFLAIVLARFEVILHDKWEEAMRDGANSDAVFVDHVSNSHEMLKECKGTVYNIGGWMLKIILQVKDKTKVVAVKWFVDANTVSVEEAREYKVGALTRLGPAFFEFALHIKAIYYANFTQDLSLRYLADLSHKIDSVIRNSSALKTTFEACYPANFTPKEKAKVWEVCEDMLDSYGKMRASDLIKALSAASRPNGSDGLALRQYVNVVHSFCRY
jgi:hypothetical protein